MYKLVLVVFVFLTISSTAQKAAKLYQKAQVAFDQKNYTDVLEISDRLPKEEKTTTVYYKLLAATFDSLRRYPDAIHCYQLYTAQATDSVAMRRLTALQGAEEKRQAVLKAKFEKIKDCPRCHGTDSVPSEITCTKCAGFKVIKKRCNRCKGTGTMTCGSCGGTGVQTSANQSTACVKCGSTGGVPCTMYCDRGYLSEDCRYCSGLGHVTAQFKCELHE